ncbi:MAG: hypothetical protein ACXWB8_12355 [Ramlibacter sp.]
MDELLANPAVQAGVAPFVVALVFSAALFRSRLLGLAMVAAFATAVALTVGYSFESLTAVRKLILVGLASGVVVLAIELPGAPASARMRAGLALAIGAAAVWVVWRVLQQQEATKIALYGAGVALFTAALLESSSRAAADVIGGVVTSLMLGLAAGALAVLGASALLGQIGISSAAGAGAVLVVQAIAGRRSPSGWTIVLPGTIIAALVLLLAVFTGSLPWYCLLPTLAIPWATRVFAPGRCGIWFTAAVTGLAAVIPAGIAIGLAWFGVASPG